MIKQITPVRVRITAFEERPNAKKRKKQASPSKRVAVYTGSHVFHTLYGFLFSSKGILFYRGGVGMCLQGNLWYSPPGSMTSRLVSVTFKMASKVFIEETDKNLDFIAEILFRFLGFRGFKVPIVIEN